MITHESIELALIVRSGFRADGIEFFTPNSYSQQLGYMNRPAGHVIRPHVHNPLPRQVDITNEVLLVKSGRMRVDFYDANRNFVESRTLSTATSCCWRMVGTGSRCWNLARSSRSSKVRTPAKTTRPGSEHGPDLAQDAELADRHFL